VDEDEANAWDDMTRFYAKYSRYDDVSLASSQDTIVKHAKNIIQANRRFLDKHAEELEAHLPPKESITVTANFFRDAERTLFSKGYDLFTTYLSNNGWKMMSVVVDDDDTTFM